MAEKDITEKILESYNDVFADIVNGLLFGGREIIKENELFDKVPRAAYKADGKIREQERDVAKLWKKQNIRIACLGVENQIDAHPYMPVRVIGYDGGDYRAQLNDDSQKVPGPVVTLVLYFGYKKRWDKPKTLLECLNVSQELKPYVSDYKINVFEIAYLDDDTVNNFKSDFRIVADYFVQMRKNGDYKPSPQTMKHVNEVLQLLSVMTSDHRYEEVYSEAMKGEAKNMCEVLDRVETRGKNTGIAIGEARALSLMQKLFAQGRIEDAKKATVDSEFCEKLLKEFEL